MKIIKVPYINYNLGVPRQHWNSNFSNLIIYDDAIIDVVESFIRKPFNLFIWGIPGVGKTHLSVSLYKTMLAKLEVLDEHGVRFVEWQKFYEAIRGGMEDNSVEEVLDSLLSSNVLFLDDVPFAMSDFEAKMFSRFIVDRYNTTKKFVITSNESPSDFMAVFRPHEADRFKHNLVIVQLTGDSKR